MERFAYPLPEERIAQEPREPRDAALMLVDRGPDAPPEHRTVRDLPSLLDAGDVLVVNDTRVLPARLRARKASGGAVEVLLLDRAVDGSWRALVRPGRRVPPGTTVTVGELAVTVGDEVGDGVRRVALGHRDGGTALAGAEDGTGSSHGSSWWERHLVERRDRAGDQAPDEGPWGGAGSPAGRTDPTAAELAALEAHGQVPLPPYIHADLDDPERYQTVYARRPGSVAAPTAGLHLTDEVLAACRRRGVRVEAVELQVGLGTFRPLSGARVDDHVMHAEAYRVAPEVGEACATARAAGGRVVAVGTTVLRALEAAASSGQAEGRTDLYIHGDHRFAVVDRLLTNFHVPRSSLLVLVDAFVGPRWRRLYDEALAGGYRFLSFGDCCLLDRRWGRRP